MKLIGNNGVIVRSVIEDDAEFILSLRLDNDLNKHLSTVENDLKNQIEFIKHCKHKEEQKQEYYFIIEYKFKSVGTVRLYNIDYEKSTFTWGSWIVQRGNPGLVALSSAYMSYYFGFNYLNLFTAEIDVRKENLSAFNLYKTYCELLHSDDLNYYLELKKESFYIFVDKYKARIPSEIEVV